ncbi:helix-turn-helix domain-containing protein [Tabrizicola fusiformis]|uniref:helix-turn-helix domain-containing protein n=1 Tax=Tabrizicola sp. SY72 TaxID=2741673 RepID=UPI0015738A9E|nr:helix-turn-helix domain-containing protein [Tabrizicola sp. SY72]NTT88229.1 helix-turn-helix domain-containing protein [Tabrizicola sp. SY72]
MTKQEPALDHPGIIAEIHRRGMTLTELAKRNDYNPNVFRQVKSRTLFKVQKIIADFIDRKPEELWPSRYPKGKPRILDTAKYPPMASQNADAPADKRAAA